MAFEWAKIDVATTLTADITKKGYYLNIDGASIQDPFSNVAGYYWGSGNDIALDVKGGTPPYPYTTENYIDTPTLVAKYSDADFQKILDSGQVKLGYPAPPDRGNYFNPPPTPATFYITDFKQDPASVPLYPYGDLISPGSTSTVYVHFNAPNSKLFTSGSDTVDFNDLSTDQQSAVASGAPMFNGQGGSDNVTLPNSNSSINATLKNIGSAATWNDSSVFNTGATKDDTTFVAGGANRSNIVVGGAGDDVFHGGGQSNTFTLNGGHDEFDGVGHTGVNTAIFQGPAHAYKLEVSKLSSLMNLSFSGTWASNDGNESLNFSGLDVAAFNGGFSPINNNTLTKLAIANDVIGTLGTISALLVGPEAILVAGVAKGLVGVASALASSDTAYIASRESFANLLTGPIDFVLQSVKELIPGGVSGRSSGAYDALAEKIVDYVHSAAESLFDKIEAGATPYVDNAGELLGDLLHKAVFPQVISDLASETGLSTDDVSYFVTGGGISAPNDLTVTTVDFSKLPLDGSPINLNPNPELTQLASSYGPVVHDATSPGGEVYALYKGLLNRAPDTAGMHDWSAALNSGTSLHDVTTAMLASPEAKIHLNATDNAGFVEQVYETVLGRHADAAGLQTWTSALDSGTSRADVVDSFVFSPEHIASLQPALNAGIFVPDQNAINIAQLYYAELGRAPDAAGLQGYTSALESGSTSLHDIAQAALNSPEYVSSHGGVSDTAYVQTIYQQVLGRAADASGLQTWTDALAHGSDRASVVTAFVDSPEFQGQYTNQSNAAYVEALYAHVLGRQGDAAGVQSWADLLDSHAESRIDLANAFVGSPEFQAHLSQLSGGQSDTAFVQSLYENALGREADAGGLQSWTDALAHGTSRADVAVSIAESPEAQTHLAAQIQQGWHLA